MTSVKFWLLIITFGVVSIDGHAQRNKRHGSKDYDSLRNATSSLTIGSYYSDKVLFWGHDLGIRQHGIAPYLLIGSENGLYLYAVNYYWSEINSKPGETDIGVGYEMHLSKRLYAYAGYERWFAHAGDTYDRYVLRNYLTAVVSCDFNLFNLEPVFYYMWGIEDVFVSDILINRRYVLFPVGKRFRVSLSPEVLASFANQSFWPLFSDYEADANALQLVDLEANTILSIESKEIELELAAHYNRPVSPDRELEAAFFYFTVHLNYKFSFYRRIRK